MLPSLSSLSLNDSEDETAAGDSALKLIQKRRKEQAKRAKQAGGNSSAPRAPRAPPASAPTPTPAPAPTPAPTPTPAPAPVEAEEGEECSSWGDDLDDYYNLIPTPAPSEMYLAYKDAVDRKKREDARKAKREAAERNQALRERREKARREELDKARAADRAARDAERKEGGGVVVDSMEDLQKMLESLEERV